MTLVARVTRARGPARGHLVWPLGSHELGWTRPGRQAGASLHRVRGVWCRTPRPGSRPRAVGGRLPDPGWPGLLGTRRVPGASGWGDGSRPSQAVAPPGATRPEGLTGWPSDVAPSPRSHHGQDQPGPEARSRLPGPLRPGNRPRRPGLWEPAPGCPPLIWGPRVWRGWVDVGLGSPSLPGWAGRAGGAGAVCWAPPPPSSGGSRGSGCLAGWLGEAGVSEHPRGCDFRPHYGPPDPRRVLPLQPTWQPLPSLASGSSVSPGSGG